MKFSMHVMYKGMSYRINYYDRYMYSIHLMKIIHVTCKSFVFRFYSGKLHEGKCIDSIWSDKRTGAGWTQRVSRIATVSKQASMFPLKPEVQPRHKWNQKQYEFYLIFFAEWKIFLGLKNTVIINISCGKWTFLYWSLSQKHWILTFTSIQYEMCNSRVMHRNWLLYRSTPNSSQFPCIPRHRPLQSTNEVWNR